MRSKYLALGFKISSDLIAATLVGFFLGWLLDKYLTSAPWGMVIFALLGIIAGIRNVLRSLGQFSSHLDSEE